jgi:hypothetical protein
MTSNRAVSVAVLFLIFGMSGVAGAQGKHGDKGSGPPQGDKGGGNPHGDKGGGNPHADKPAPQPRPAPAPPQHVEQQRPQQAQHVQKHDSAPRVERSAPPQHVERRVQVQHASAPRVEHAAPLAHAQRPAPIAHVQRATFVPPNEQQQRVRQQQEYVTQYRQRLSRDTRLAQEREAQLLKQNRRAQYRFQQQYYARLAQQQAALQAARDYSRDPYVTAPYSYEYVVSGSPRYTNQYGANVLKQAVDYGYQQGYEAGQADRQDGWAADYRNSYAYSDANYGYGGTYVNQSDYNYYFRQGFQRGYNDGYYSRSQYGSYLNGSPSILSTVLSAILGLTSLR